MGDVPDDAFDADFLSIRLSRADWSEIVALLAADALNSEFLAMGLRSCDKEPYRKEALRAIGIINQILSGLGGALGRLWPEDGANADLWLELLRKRCANRAAFAPQVICAVSKEGVAAIMGTPPSALRRNWCLPPERE
jgi:hypothetical protein